MPTTRDRFNLFAGVDHLSLDRRSFNPSHDDLAHVCRFFSIGKLLNFEKEKGIVVSHSNFFVFVQTSRGKFALKFYPADAAKTLQTEYFINRFLTLHHFSTPKMYAGNKGRPFCLSHTMLAACYDYIEGKQAWQEIKKHTNIRRINSSLCSLKNLLSKAPSFPFPKKTALAEHIQELAQAYRELAPYDDEKLIVATLKDICHSYQNYHPLFVWQRIHNDITLTNFLIDRKTVHIIDLSHIMEDYVLSDLASLVVSCQFLGVPKTTIKCIIDDYFWQHKIGTEYYPVLNTLIKISLIIEHVRNVHREKFINGPDYPSDILKTYMFHLKKRKDLIVTSLKRMTDQRKIIV